MCESIHAKVEQNLGKAVYQEEDNIAEQEEVTIQEKDNAVSQKLQESVKNNDKEFTLDFEKVANQSSFELGSDKLSQDISVSIVQVQKILTKNCLKRKQNQQQNTSYKKRIRWFYRNR